MRSYQNPFRSRASEQQRDTYGFLRHVGVGVVDLLPEAIWDRPLIVRSASGGGKTTLLRLFTAESLLTAHARRDDLPGLVPKLENADALDDDGPKRFGLMLNLGRDYRSLANSGAPPEVASLLFLRLLDARIATGAVRGALTLRGLRYPEDAARLHLSLRGDDDRAVAAAERLGGVSGDNLVSAARRVEAEVAHLLDSLLPVDWAETTKGHSELYSLRLLSDADFVVDDVMVNAQLLLLFDDGHELAEAQRAALLRSLVDRDTTVARWYAERFEALHPDELLRDDTAGRDYELLELERSARESSASAGRKRFDRLLREVGNLRAGRHLERYAQGDRDFFEYLEPPTERVSTKILSAVREDALKLADGNDRYLDWVKQADSGSSYERAVRLRASAILISRYLRRPQQSLFDVEVTNEFDGLLKSDIREAARLFLCKDHDLPYYAGEDMVVSLSSHNVEQFLRLCGDLFEYMLGQITLNQRPVVDAAQQQRIIRRASDQYWRELGTRLPHAPDTIALLQRIADVAVSETYRPTAPYSPGVTGIAISMRDRALLVDPKTRMQIDGGQQLYDALAGAIARNVLIAELDYSVKNTRVMVLYLNRLLCPKVFLPIWRGGFRERPVADVAGWLADPSGESEALEMFGR